MKAYPRACKWRAAVSLTVAAALIIETACSGTPPPPPPQLTSSPSEIQSRLVLYAQDNAVIRLHLDDGTIIPTAHYALTDSSVVVVEDVLRGRDYMPELNVAHLFSKQRTKELPDSVTLPVRVSMDRIVALQSWNFPSRPNAVGEEVAPRLAVYAAEKVVARIHTADGTIISTSSYEVDDSSVVISNVLRDAGYIEQGQPQLYGKSSYVKTLPKDVTLPLRIPTADVTTVEPWGDPHVTRRGLVTGLIVISAVTLFAIWASNVEIDVLNGDSGTWTGP